MCALERSTGRLSLVPAPAVERSLDSQTLRGIAWEIGSREAHRHYAPPGSRVTIAMITPSSGFATFRIDPGWVEARARERGQAWNGSRPVLRLYDVSFLCFNGMNAHRHLDQGLSGLAGQLVFKLPYGGTSQLAEVGFLLRSGEFLPASRSGALRFAPDGVSKRQDTAALYVDARLEPEPVASLWQAESFLWERQKPRLRRGLKAALFSFECRWAGQDTLSARFISELAHHLQTLAVEPHLFFPATEHRRESCLIDGVRYHPLPVESQSEPVEMALGFVHAVESSLTDLPRFDFFHLSEWLTGLVPWIAMRPTVLSLTSTESVRCGGVVSSQASHEIQKIEREIVTTMECILTPRWLRETVIAEYGVAAGRVHAFPLDGALAREWDAPLEEAAVKQELGLAPEDRLLLFIGPLEAPAGPDLLLDALLTLCPRHRSLRAAYVGGGAMAPALSERAARYGLAERVLWLGHVDSARLSRIARASEALVLPYRERIAYDEDLVALARFAGRPVLATHAGPSHLVKHERDGLLLYSHKDSVVWGIGRLLEDPDRATRMGEAGLRAPRGAVDWEGVAEVYAELLALSFPELAEPRD